MELLIINIEDSVFFEVDENAMVKLGLVFADKITDVSPFFYDIIIFKAMEKMTDKQLFEYYIKTIEESNREDKEEILKQGKRMYHDMVELKKIKYKDRDSQNYLSQLESNFKLLKRETMELDRKHMEKNGMITLLNFYNDGVFNPILHDPETEKPAVSIPDRLIKEFTDSDVIQFFDEFILMRKDEDDDNETDDFLSCELFTIPDLDSLSYTQLKIMRQEFMETFKPFYKSVTAMQQEFAAVLFNEENQEFIDNRTTEILEPYMVPIKTTVENNIYIQHLKNSSHDSTDYTLYFCVASIEMIVGFYKMRKIITIEEALDILTTVAEKKDISTCCFFFYYYSHMKNLPKEV